MKCAMKALTKHFGTQLLFLVLVMWLKMRTGSTEREDLQAVITLRQILTIVNKNQLSRDG